MNLFVVNMAASDLLTTVLVIPVDIGTFAKGKWPIHHNSTAGLVLCKTMTTVWYLSTGVSLLSLVAISADRFWAVFFPTSRSLTTRKPTIILVSIWLVNFMFGFPHLFEASVFQISGEKVVCWSELEFSPYFECPYIAVLGVFPTIVTLFVYPAILIKLWKRRIPGNPSSTNKELRDKTNLKVTILALSLMVSYVVSWLPYIEDRIEQLHTPDNTFDILNPAYTLSYASCVLNPLVCIILNQNFRSGFKLILQPLCTFRCIRANNSFESNRENTFQQSCQNCIELNEVQLTKIRTLTSIENLGKSYLN